MPHIEIGARRFLPLLLSKSSGSGSRIAPRAQLFAELSIGPPLGDPLVHQQGECRATHIA